MKNAPTLIDGLLGETFKSYYRQMDRDGWMRTRLLEARRFVLDEKMSAFMADLSYAALPKVRNPKRDHEIINGIRTLARLPHKVTWIEYDMRARIKRAKEAYDVSLNADTCPAKGGWLFVQHPVLETAFLAVECLSHCLDGDFDDLDLGRPLIAKPSGHFINWVWTTDDVPLPQEYRCGPNFLRPIEQQLGRPVEAFMTGIESYTSKSVGLIAAPYTLHSNLWDQVEKDPRIMANYISQSASDMRYAWSLLAAINDTPVIAETVRPSKGYVARGRYHKFLEHTTIKLNIPGKLDLRTLAKRVSRLSRRRAHEVRGHWRINWRDRTGEKLWIPEYQRGDASLGFVTHNYAVTHDQP